MKKFKVGDIVRGTKESDSVYLITNSRVLLIVKEVHEKFITVEVYNALSEHYSLRSASFDVNPDYFSLNKFINLYDEDKK